MIDIFQFLISFLAFLFPLTFYGGILLFSGYFNGRNAPSSSNTVVGQAEKQKPWKQKGLASTAKGLCTSSNCVRCNRNREEFFFAMERFSSLGYFGDRRCSRVETALLASLAALKAKPSPQIEGSEGPNGGDEILLKLDLAESRPIWPGDRLSQILRDDIAKLRQSFTQIVADCEKIFKYPVLWSRNDEPGGGFWYTYSLINQGQWQEDQCAECPQLVSVLHKLESLITDCLLGNVFVSMLPRESSIAEHRGITNARLRVHFGVEIPSDADHCFMDVGGQRFTWSAGEATVIDDSFPHSVSSRGCTEDRVVLVVDVWNPQLSTRERQCLRQIFPASD